MPSFKNFKVIHNECGKEAIIVFAQESRSYDDVDPDIILTIKCEHCNKTYREKL